MEENGIPEESPYLITHLRELVELLDEDERDALSALLDEMGISLDGDSQSLITAFTALIDTLEPELQDLLADALELQSPTDDWIDLDPAVLIDFGLIVPVTLGETDYYVIPIEVRLAAFRGELGEMPPPLALHLYYADEEDLEEIADFYQVGSEDHIDDVDIAIAVADAALERDTILRAFSSLSPLARRLLIWLASTSRQPLATDYEAMAYRLATSPTEARTAMRVLGRLGYVHAAPHHEELVQVPVDVMTMLWGLLDDDLVGASREAYGALRARSTPAMRDHFPRGAGGDALTAARYDLMLALIGHEVPDQVRWNLTMLRIYDAEEEAPGEWASRLLDLSGPDAFARTALRAWLGVLGDDFTQQLVRAVGGDARAVTAALFAAAEAADNDDLRADIEAMIQEWSELIYAWRAHLILLLSLLPPGHWYRLDALAAWMVGQYRLTRWQRGIPLVFDTVVPASDLPVEIVEVGPQHVPKMTRALRSLIRKLLEPLGAVMLDDSETLLLLNPESLRAIRDHDPNFDTLWREADSVVAADLDLWLPGPTEVGNRVRGLASPRWLYATSIEIADDAHLTDLIRLCQWADPVRHRDRFVFVFTEESTHRGASLGADPEETLVWLHARTGQPIPPSVRALFNVSTSLTDHDDDQAETRAAGYVADLFEQAESWGASPSSALIEELRGWGDTTIRALVPWVEERVNAGRWDEPMLRHALLLLGDMRVEAASAELLRALAFAPEREVELAAAMACARIGTPVLDGLVTLLHNGAADVNKRLAAAGTLSALAVLHPQHTERIARELAHLIATLDEDPETATIAALSLAETGHASAEKTLYELREQNGWVDEVLPFNEALWIAGVSPSVWGPPNVAAPIAHLYATASERRALEDRAELGEMLALSGISESALGHSRPRWRKKA